MQSAGQRKHEGLEKPPSISADRLKSYLLRLFGASGGQALDRLAEVVPVPITELAASILPCDNGGPYERDCETHILGSDAVRAVIADAPKLVEPLPYGIAQIDHAIVCGEGIIWKKTPDGLRAVKETLIGAQTPRSVLPLVHGADDALYADANIRPRKLPPRNTYAFIRQVRDNNYGHWLIEGLPKIDLLAEHFDLSDLKFIVTRHYITRQSGPMRKIYFDSLAAAGIGPQQIVEVTREAVEVERLLYPRPLTIHSLVKAPRPIRFLEKLRDKIAAGSRGPRRIYVSRAGAAKRRLLNETQILRILKDLDVTVVHPERHAFAEQVGLFANAELVIGNYGANLTNVVFSPRGVTLFAITSEAMLDDFFWDLANLKGGRYFSLHGKAASQTPDQNSDFYVDADELHAVLKERVLAG